ncbi:MYP0 protein, partial [Certhia brachydactyla]|nr:MYP0 protein [Certhia brachydactyla]
VSPVSPIHVYTQREVYGTVGASVTLSCSFWSSEWISDDISITWHFQADGSRDSISVRRVTLSLSPPHCRGCDTLPLSPPRCRRGSHRATVPSSVRGMSHSTTVPSPVPGMSHSATVPSVPPRYGVVLGSVIAGVLLLVALLVALVYGTRYLWRRRQAVLQRRLSAMEKGKLQRSGKDGSKRGRQAPVLYAMLDHGRSSKKAKGDSRKDRK